MKRILLLLMALCLLLWGCSEGEPLSSAGPSPTVDFAQTDSDLFTKRDLAGTWEAPVTVTLQGNSAQCDDAGVAIDGSTVTLRAQGTYLLTGSLEGSVIVDAPEDAKIQLVLSGADISNPNGAAIFCENADKVFVTLAPGTENSLSGGETLPEDTDGTLHSRCDLTLNGSGQLTITAPGGHGITAKDDLAITGGTYHITSAGHGLDANDSIRICGGSFTLDTGKDGLHAEHKEDAALGFVYLSGGDFAIEAEGDGISAGSTLQIEAGTYEILAGGGYENGQEHSSGGWGDMGGGGPGKPGGGMGGGRPRSGAETTQEDASEDASTSMKGLKSGTQMLIAGGSFTIDSADDAIHSNGSATVSGGTFAIATGDDGVHAEETLTVTACTMDISTCYEGLEAAYLYIQGGEFTMVCDDDGLNAAGGTDESGFGGRDEMFGGGFSGGTGGFDYGLIQISGGSLTIHAGGDGLDSNGDLLISGGITTVYNPRSGDTSVLDSQNSPVITGGTYIGLGMTLNMAQTFSETDSTQGVIACSVGSQAAGQEITVTSSAGQVVLTAKTEYSTALMILSCPEIRKGESYTVTIGTTSGTLEAS